VSRNRRLALELAWNGATEHTAVPDILTNAEQLLDWLNHGDTTGDGLTKAPENTTKEPKLRTLSSFGKTSGDPTGLAFEITPGVFSWGDSRKNAAKYSGWKFPNTFYRFVDVETGEEVTA
jgi:hypothetical protein